MVHDHPAWSLDRQVTRDMIAVYRSQSHCSSPDMCAYWQIIIAKQGVHMVHRRLPNVSSGVTSLYVEEQTWHLRGSLSSSPWKSTITTPKWRRLFMAQKVERRKSVAGWMISVSFASRRWTRRGSMSR